MAEVKSIPTEAAFNSHLSSLPPSTLLIIYFHAPWAAPCKQVSSILEALAGTYPATAPLAFLSLNAEDLPEVSERYDVTAVPFLVLQRDGQTLESVSGSDAGKIRAAVEKFAGAAGGGAGGANGVGLLPPAQKVTRPVGESVPAQQQNGGTVTKDLSSYAPSTNANDAPNGEEAEPVSKEDLWKRLESLVKAAPVMLFMKGTPSAPQCGFSRQTVALLRERSIRYGFFNILADDDVRQGLKEFSDWPTYPQLYVDGELVGGLDIVKEEFQNNPDFLLEYSVNAQKSDGAVEGSSSVPQAA